MVSWLCSPFPDLPLILKTEGVRNGFDYLIAKAFADSLGVNLRVQPKQSLRNLLVVVGGPQGDFAAANLVPTAKRSRSLIFSDPYLEVTQQLLYRRGTPKPKITVRYRR